MSNFSSVTIGDMLQRSNEFIWDHFILICSGDEVSVQTQVLVVEEEYVEKGVTVDGKTYSYLMGVQTMQEIVDNVKEQKENVTTDELVEAFKYYISHDAFIEL